MSVSTTKSELIGFLRLENHNDNHYKFYEMKMTIHPDRPLNNSCDVIIRYGRIGTNGKIMPLKGRSLGLPVSGASEINPHLGKQAFLRQLKKKFKDKKYSLNDLKVYDERLKKEIIELQDEFEGGSELYDRIAEMLEDRGF